MRCVVRSILIAGLACLLGCPPAWCSSQPDSPFPASSSKGSLNSGTSVRSHHDTFSPLTPDFLASLNHPRAFSRVHPLGRPMLTDDGGPSKAVLSYLQNMIELSRKFHRQDMVDFYTDAWELAAVKIYGPLPARLPARGYYAQPTPKPAAPAPQWKQQMLAKPFRKIVARFTAVEDGLSISYEQLECGHRVLAGIDPPDSPQAQRRRCSECAHVGKKSAASETTPRKKEQSA